MALWGFEVGLSVVEGVGTLPISPAEACAEAIVAMGREWVWARLGNPSERIKLFASMSMICPSPRPWR